VAAPLLLGTLLTASFLSAGDPPAASMNSIPELEQSGIQM
jgi:hypothetical protein